MSNKLLKTALFHNNNIFITTNVFVCPLYSFSFLPVFCKELTHLNKN